jgi:hypothetical protein
MSAVAYHASVATTYAMPPTNNALTAALASPTVAGAPMHSARVLHHIRQIEGLRELGIFEQVLCGGYFFVPLEHANQPLELSGPRLQAE